MKHLKNFNDSTTEISFKKSTNYVESYVGYVRENKTVYYNKEKNLIKVVVKDNETTIISKLTEAQVNGENVTLTGGTNILNIDSDYPYGMVTYDKSNNISRIDFSSYTGTTIWPNAFANCSSVKTLKIPNNIVTINGGAFSNCSSLRSIRLPNKLSFLGPSVFTNCTALTTITLPDTLKQILQFTFSNCSSLTEVILPKKLETIIARTFENCTALSSITIPENVQFIGSDIFKGCSSLSDITLLSPTPKDNQIKALKILNIQHIYVPQNSVQLYKDSPICHDYIDKIMSIVEYEKNSNLSLYG